MELLFLLLPVAALSGWYIGRRKAVRSRKYKEGCAPLSSDYFQGLNYLLNEQQDEALEVFIRMSEQDNETVDIQFALASLFLRRGEVDRAIRIHQNLIARPMLSHPQRKRALYELGRDYMRAGLLDRAESLFLELTDDTLYAEQGRRQLLDIYQQEKEWDKAIAVAQRLKNKNDQTLSPVIAHFYCEQAEEAINAGEYSAAQRLLKRAVGEDRNSVRATLLEARIAERHGQLKQAIRIYQRVESQDADYLPMVIGPLKHCYEQLGTINEYRQYLYNLSKKEASISLVIALARLLQGQGKEHLAIEKLLEHLQQRPSLRALDYLLELRTSHHHQGQEIDLNVLHEVTHELLAAKPVCQCSHCGFTARTLHWQCPSCKHWGTLKPIHGIEGE
ncbi:MAG: lipopolysaccharide assembly protein LapB [Gammaproteobacteria bacterium]|nr:lipopolysaccharide assembly protein LapB [Gammaproteobacteria bacterium]MCW8840267.1 lipopolysaccharide assembly protein LapB [Gammaproteobacteria bacterium]MCW8927194.1 lipopolysaccharide assembly protein LapB [Gammaproteobacteria bacterium]MCW8959251.1 lipopolysaccharide assembly protein LapB [Gammaproteobacteria bacterium]MCW8973597.1 lipopolysaccharide assembly protein LapB [Gammaproteobacteria bacterium]